MRLKPVSFKRARCSTVIGIQEKFEFLFLSQMSKVRNPGKIEIGQGEKI